MPHRQTINLVAVALSVAALACTIPPEVLDAINRLPTPTATRRRHQLAAVCCLAL